MTMRLVLGVDPGQTGAIAALADGEFAGFADMPTMPRKAGGHQINATQLAAELRGLRMAHPGAFCIAVIEQVHALPKQGSASGFRFGQSDGIARGVLGALGIALVEVAPQTWKRSLGLIGAEKDMARTLAIQRFPAASAHLQRKKDVGRADALLIALWAEQAEKVGRAA